MVWAYALGAVILAVITVLYYKFVDGDLRLMFNENFGTDPSELAGKVVWIVGASSGIGEHMAYELAKFQCKLVLSARRVEELERVKKKCIGVGGVPDGHVLVLPMDVLEHSTHKEKFNEVLKKFNKLDILINNAGRMHSGAWEEIALEEDKEVFDINVFSLICLTRVVLPHFIEKREGQIVLVSSLAGISGFPQGSAYSASKHAMHGYMESLRMEKILDNITVTILCPGGVETDILKSAVVSKTNKKPIEKSDHKRMTVERCAQLSVVAIANKMEVTWMCLNPVLIFLYVLHCPWLSTKLIEMMMKKQKKSKTATTEASKDK